MSPGDINSETENNKQLIFETDIRTNLGDTMTKLGKILPSDYILFCDGNLYPPALHEVDEGQVQLHGTGMFEMSIADHWINAELNLPKGK